MKLWTDRYTGNRSLSFSFWRLRGQVTWRAKPRKRAWIDNICWKCVGWKCKVRPYLCWWYGHKGQDFPDWCVTRGSLEYCRWCGYERKGS